MIDHHINVHHVYEIYGQSGYDYAFLAWGAMIVAGLLLARAAARSS